MPLVSRVVRPVDDDNVASFEDNEFLAECIRFGLDVRCRRAWASHEEEIVGFSCVMHGDVDEDSIDDVRYKICLDISPRVADADALFSACDLLSPLPVYDVLTGDLYKRIEFASV